MNRGDKGENIFSGKKLRIRFLELLQERSRIYRIVVYAYCIMDNHYHLVLQNGSGKMSEFMRNLNSQFAINYRSVMKGKGYVFQNRYKSTLIGTGEYLKMAVIYVLLNPVRAGICHTPYDYRWSSVNEYFCSKELDRMIDNLFVEELFRDKNEFDILLKEWRDKETLPVTTTRVGEVLADDSFISKAMKKFERRQTTKPSKRMRQKEYSFLPFERIIEEFEITHGVRLKDIDYTTWGGKAFRAELLQKLKDVGGLTYKEIIALEPFSELKFSSLGQIYKRTKKRKQ